ncbi:hypothetical protein CRUP_007458 [Coryphaenoides rupestris]|nr:hypothetical protein CRUP_007458 [Coryphaenoides rupestris]
MTTEKKIEMGEVQSLLTVSGSVLLASERRANVYERVIQPCLAELLGTALFVFIGCVSVVEDTQATGRLQPALVHGLAVAVLVTCMAEISALKKAMTSTENYSKAQGAAFAVLQSEEQLAGALFGEMAMTCLVALVVLLGAVNAKSRSPMAPFMRRRVRYLSEPGQGLRSGSGELLLVLHWVYWWARSEGPWCGRFGR